MYLLLLGKHMVGRAGFEPAKAKLTDLQSAPFDRSGTDPKEFYKKMEPLVGLEPTTTCLQDSCSTN